MMAGLPHRDPTPRDPRADRNLAELEADELVAIAAKPSGMVVSILQSADALTLEENVELPMRLAEWIAVTGIRVAKRRRVGLAQ